MSELIYPELSYKLVGIAFKIYNEIGGGYQEKYFQKAYKLELEALNLKFKEQIPIPLVFKGKKIGKYFLDFIIENKIVVELKVGKQIYDRDIKQVLSYIETIGLKLGIIILFTRNGVQYKRVINSKI